jgi:MoaA/NifB/PqqE/SkfB family radical SAM enzyme
MHARIDIELTNRCNAKCHFCPRDQTPHQGIMSRETFDQALARALEYQQVVHEVLHTELQIALCGLGEPLLNKEAARFTRQVTEAGIRCGMSSNASLLDERRGSELLDAGLKEIFINVGDRDDDYEDVYGLPFERTRANVVRFAEMAEGLCDVWVVLVDHRRDQAHQAEMKAYWQDYGIRLFQEYEIINRGGALFVDHMQFESYPELAEARQLLEADGERPMCGTPFGYLFVGYDGNYYLCCSDWKKEVPMGTVFDRSFIELTGDKLRRVVSREPICKTCNLDPLNMLADELRAISEGVSESSRRDEVVMVSRETSRYVADLVEKLEPGVVAKVGDASESAPRRLIPVTSR